MTMYIVIDNSGKIVDDEVKDREGVILGSAVLR